MRVYINNRNYVTWPKNMADHLAAQGHEPIFIDNGSNYEPLLEYYKNCPYTVHRLENIGKDAPWISGIVLADTDYHAVTDPDLDISMIPDDWADILLAGFHEHPGAGKYGFSLEEKRVPPENCAHWADKMNEHPPGSDGWLFMNGLSNNWFHAAMDTTFAVYPPGYAPGMGNFIGGIRKGPPYCALHLPWHVTLDPTETPGAYSIPMDDEVLFYFENVQNSTASIGRMIPMMVEYKRRKNGELPRSFGEVHREVFEAWSINYPYSTS